MRDRLVELVQDALFQHAHYVAKERQRALKAETEAEHSEIYESIKTLHEYVADHLIENGVIVPQWISVKDRLPDNEERVLVAVDSDKSDTKIDTDRMVFRQWIGGTLYYCPFPRCPFVKVEKQEAKDERTK